MEYIDKNGIKRKVPTLDPNFKIDRFEGQSKLAKYIYIMLIILVLVLVITNNAINSLEINEQYPSAHLLSNE